MKFLIDFDNKEQIVAWCHATLGGSKFLWFPAELSKTQSSRIAIFVHEKEDILLFKLAWSNKFINEETSIS